MLRNRRRLRRWAIQVLLVWLFGIVTGIAHACAVRIADDHRGSAHRHHGAMVADHSSHSHGHAVLPGEDTAGKANCLDFCEKASLSAQPLKFRLDPSAEASAMAHSSSASPDLIDWPARTFARSGGVFYQHRGPPLRIALQRLAL